MKIQEFTKYTKVSQELTFKELAIIYDCLKDDHGKIALKELGKEIIHLEKQYAFSFAQFARIIKSSDNAYRVSKK